MSDRNPCYSIPRDLGRPRGTIEMYPNTPVCDIRALIEEVRRKLIEDLYKRDMS